MAKYLNLSDKYESQKLQEIMRQKLLDIFYTASDGDSFHVILDCRSNLK
jgi:hypothetical protein